MGIDSLKPSAGMVIEMATAGMGDVLAGWPEFDRAATR